MQREQGLDGSPKARCGWPAEEIRVPVWAGGLGGAGFHAERIDLLLTYTKICLANASLLKAFINYTW